ncbi:hypothetical protein B0T25DRAFT_297102 [Lasiosphaeria hispida]|uniref:DUF3176 domain-containing protein n=1 Tax=Lasiosphaeria hispida TaxID=260671 RepID=A0AAJ0HD96_9PEZI|nr:hypothetical protein B0T25DRAFT_297102 [Lasiosphaeria hispida]
MAYQQVQNPNIASADTIVTAPEPAHAPGNTDAGEQGPYQFINLDTSYPPQDPSQVREGQQLNQQEKQQTQFGEEAVSPDSPLGWDAKRGSNGTGHTGRASQLSRQSIFSRSSTWTFEVASLIVAILAVAAIIAVLAFYDNKPLPSWPSSITLNAVIAVLATVATASMSVPLSSGLGQLKWIRFREGRAPLSDMEHFDDASRGALGAINLLFRARGGLAGSFGAFIMVIGLLLSPFAQQMTIYPSREVHTRAGAVNMRALKYDLKLSGDDDLAAFVPILPIKSAVYNGLFAENNKPSMNLPVKCSTGNCTWGEIETLAICHSCVDMTEYMTRYCAAGVEADGNQTLCGWQLPSGAVLNTSAEVFSMTSLFPGSFNGAYSTIMRLVFMGTEAQLGPKNVLKPWAQQCTLSACVQTISSSITNGELNETVTHTALNETVPNTQSVIDHLNPVDITSPRTNETYSMSMQSILAWQAWFATLFRNGTASRNTDYINQTMSTAPGSPNIVVNLTVGISEGETFFDTDVVQAFYWNYYEYPAGIEMLMHDLGVSLTVSLRSVNKAAEKQEVNGTAVSVETFVQVRWGFVAVPAVAVVLTAAFLGVAVWKTWRSGTKLWKSSALAMLFHGLDEGGRERFEVLDGLQAKKREARGVKVKLEETDGAAGGVLKIDRVY